MCLDPRLLLGESKLLLNPGLLLYQLELRMVRGRAGLRSKQPRVVVGDEGTGCVVLAGREVEPIICASSGDCCWSSSLKQSCYSKQRCSRKKIDHVQSTNFKFPSLFLRRSFVILTLDRDGSTLSDPVVFRCLNR